MPAVSAAGVRLEKVRVRHEGRAHDSLPETTLTVRPGETVALAGPSGAGKSTLLHVLLGFTGPAAGRVRVGDVDLAEADVAEWHAQIAWVPQHPHLFAGTVADNVRLARPDASDEDVMGALREAAAGELSADTVLGEGGSGLSAGQRQRVALARAFLADRPLLLLDEPTAALDGATEEAVVDAVRRLARGRTVLLVAHRPALFALADRVVTLGSGGGQPAPVAQKAVSPGQSPSEEHNAPHLPAPRTIDGEPVPQHAGPRPPEHGPHTNGPHTSGPHTNGPQTTGARHVLARVRETGRPLYPRFGLALLLGALALGSAVGLMATSGWLISRASQQPPVLYLMVAVTATRAFGIGRAVFRYAERLVSHDAVLRVLAGLRVTVYRRLERLAPAGLGRRRRGDLLTRLVSDVDTLQDYFLRWLLPASVAAAVGLGSVVFTTWLLPAAGAALAAGLLVAGVAVPVLTGALARRTERQLAPARSRLTTRTVDLLTGTGELTVAGALPSRTREVRAADAELTRIATRSAAATALAAGLTALASGLTVAAAAWAGAQAVYDGRLTGVALAVVVLTPLAAFEAVNGLPLAVQHRQRVRRSAERVHEVLDSPEPVRESPHPRQAPETAFPLEVRGLTVRYPGQPGPPALQGFDLELVPGRRVAVVGVSGAGKSTLAQALLRFVEPESGTYELGGVPAAQLASDEVRRRVGLCAQDAHIFDSSLRENLRLARPDATDAELRTALEGARLDGWVDTLPEGLDTRVGEHGARMSGGQRQRLALARALLAGFPVLVLDEPAEHLDLATADALTADLLAATEGRTTVLITHRLAGLEAVDEVLVLDRGRVAERGPYHRLASGDGPFRRMLDREAAVPEPAGEPAGVS